MRRGEMPLTQRGRDDSSGRSEKFEVRLAGTNRFAVSGKENMREIRVKASAKQVKT